jgi:hypothetical protein
VPFGEWLDPPHLPLHFVASPALSGGLATLSESGSAKQAEIRWRGGYGNRVYGFGHGRIPREWIVAALFIVRGEMAIFGKQRSLPSRRRSIKGKSRPRSYRSTCSDVLQNETRTRFGEQGTSLMLAESGRACPVIPRRTTCHCEPQYSHSVVTRHFGSRCFDQIIGCN